VDAAFARRATTAAAAAKISMAGIVLSVCAPRLPSAPDDGDTPLLANG
jgi:hypothetical protein